MPDPTDMVSVRYLVDDVDASVAFYTTVLGFEVLNELRARRSPTSLGATCGCCSSGPSSSAGQPMADGETPGPGGWNRIHLIVDDIEAEVARLRDAGARFRNDILAGPGGKQILVLDPSGQRRRAVRVGPVTAATIDPVEAVGPSVS